MVTVATVYVGASAELVRGFITTPLERVIAAADGIDYIESESRQNVSIIRARLRLDHDATAKLARWFEDRWTELEWRGDPRMAAWSLDDGSLDRSGDKQAVAELEPVHGPAEIRRIGTNSQMVDPSPSP